MGVTRSHGRPAEYLGSLRRLRRATRRWHSGLVVAAVVALAAAGCGTTVPQSQRNVAAGSGDLQGVDGPAGRTQAEGSSSTGADDGVVNGDVQSGSNIGVQGSSAGGTSGSGTGGASGAGAASGIPAAGRGWDAKNVYVGVAMAKNKQQAAASAGATGIDPGDNEAQANAVAKYFNDRGGLFGRKIVLRFDDHDFAKLLSQPDTESNAACTKFTEDQPVIAVVNAEGGLDTANFRACLSEASIPLFSDPAYAFDDQTLRESKGMYFLTGGIASWSKVASVFIDRLVAQDYFSSWDTSRGGPGTAPVRVGIVGASDPASLRAFALLEAALKRAGHGDVVTYQYSNFASEANSEVLKMRSNNVTHVIGLESGLFTFATAAESQRYRPRYGVHSRNNLNTVMEQTVPDAQNVGAVGFGTLPTRDIATQSGELTPGGKICRDIMAADGQTFAGKRNQENYAFRICDSMRLIVEAALSSQGLTGPAIVAGVGKIGPSFAPAVTFASGLTSTYQVLASAGVDVQYQTSCSCYQYVNTTLRRL